MGITKFYLVTIYVCICECKTNFLNYLNTMNTNPDAKRILIYGDSITWGRVACESERFDVSTRYTGVVQKELGDSYEIIEEGLRGRTAKGENGFFPNKNGFDQFPVILASHLPLDMLIIFLGTNDTNNKSQKDSKQIVDDLESYIEVVGEVSSMMSIEVPKLMFIAPPLVDENNLRGDSMFEGAYEKGKDVSGYLKRMTMENNCYYFDSNGCIQVCNEDGVHIDGEANVRLGEELVNYIITLDL